MVDEADNGLADEEQAEPDAGDASDPTAAGGRSPGVMRGVFWGLGRAARGVTVGSAWFGNVAGGAIVSAFKGVGSGARAIKPDGGEPASGDEDAPGAEDAGEEAAPDEEVDAKDGKRKKR